MKLWTSLPELSRWPSASFALLGANWREHPAAAYFQGIAAAVDRLGSDSVSVPEHVVLPRAGRAHGRPLAGRADRDGVRRGRHHPGGGRGQAGLPLRRYLFNLNNSSIVY